MEQALKVSETTAGTEGILSLQGDCTMASAKDVRQALLDAIDKVDVLYLDLSEIGAVDVSFMQILCAAHRECFLSDKKIYLQQGAGRMIDDLLDRGGYSRQMGCYPDAKKECLCSGPKSVVIRH